LDDINITFIETIHATNDAILHITIHHSPAFMTIHRTNYIGFLHLLLLQHKSNKDVLIAICFVQKDAVVAEKHHFLCVIFMISDTFPT